VRSETRRQMKQDRFRGATIDAAEKTVHWSVEHKSKLLTGGIIALLVIASVLGGWYYLNQQDEKASADLSQAVRTLDTPLRPAGMPPQAETPTFASASERATAAQKQFQAVVDKYPHTRSSEFAKYFLGLTAAELGDNAAAERDLGAGASSSNDDLSALARFALASVYRNTNRIKDAIGIYTKLIEKPTHTVSRVTAQLELGSTYESDKQPLEAKRIYEQVKKENPTGDAAQIASAKLQALK
jgi:predicted negative regulator of RcsB-dependent stress response